MEQPINAFEIAYMVITPIHCILMLLAGWHLCTAPRRLIRFSWKKMGFILAMLLTTTLYVMLALVNRTMWSQEQTIHQALNMTVGYMTTGFLLHFFKYWLLPRSRTPDSDNLYAPPKHDA